MVATYSSRPDAEAAAGLLSDHQITSFVAADDVHPPLQITEGCRVRVMGKDLSDARRVLHEAGMLPGEEVHVDGTTPDAVHRNALTRWTTWVYLAVAVLVIASLLYGLTI